MKNIIRVERAKMRISQSELAEKVGMTKMGISLIEIEKTKQQIIYDFIRFKITKDEKHKKSILEGLKVLRKYYHTGMQKKIGKIEDMKALYRFIEFNKPAYEIINQIYSQL